jgi:hypothetical protein
LREIEEIVLFCEAWLRMPLVNFSSMVLVPLDGVMLRSSCSGFIR